MIRTLIAEDSPTIRALLAEVLRADPEMEVIGEAHDGEEAVSMTRRLKPDVVTMDIHMPRLDGFEATKRIMMEAPTPIVIVSKTVEASRVAVSMQALRAGALAVVQTPPAPTAAEFGVLCHSLVSTVKAMAGVKV